MGAYNTLKINRICENCKNKVDLSIQFKYGDVWQHNYNIGDKILWGGNDEGIPNTKRVVLEGISESCSICGDRTDYLIFLENDVIKSAEINDK